MKIIDTKNLPFLLQTLKEKEYFIDGSKLAPISQRLDSIENNQLPSIKEAVDGNTLKLDHLINDSGLEITPIKSINEEVTGYEFNLYSDIDGSGSKTIIASSTLSYDVLSSDDAESVIDKVRDNI